MDLKLPLLTTYALATRAARRPRRLMDRLGEVMGLLEEHYRTKSPHEKGESRQEATGAAWHDAARVEVGQYEEVESVGDFRLALHQRVGIEDELA